MLDHSFDGTPFTVGIEEELMLIDRETLDLAHGIERVLEQVPPEREGQVKPELFQSVLEVATKPCSGVPEAAEELRALRRLVAGIAGEAGMEVAAAGTHPFARCDDQRIVERQRYLDLVADLGFVARRELIFGTHVHVGINGPDRAVYVADGIRRFLPLMLALSANSPFWEGTHTEMMSSRTPVFRAFPRVGVPPHYGNWEIYSRRVEMMMRSGAIEDYTYLWWDVRPHPNLGTVETRIFDQQTRVEWTAGLAALTQALAHRLSRMFDEREPLVEVPSELIDDNKVRAALRGMEGDLVNFQGEAHEPAPVLAERLLDDIRADAEELGCSAELESVAELIEAGTGARRQLQLWEEQGHDLRALTRAMIEQSRA